MAQLVVKKKKKGLRLTGSVGDSAGGSDLRPRHVPKTPPCVLGCPIGNNVREWIRVLRDAGPVEEAWKLVTDVNPFPAITGRVCPHPCEGECNRSHHDEAVGINDIERYIGSYGIEKNLQHAKLTDEARAEKIAVVGSGPAGMAFAYHLARRGYSVTVFEAHDKPGGMLRWGIPRYRLPAEVIDAEYGKILELGVTLKCNTRVGKDVSLEQLRKDFAVVYLAIGGQLGVKLNIPNEDGSGVLSGVGFLEDIAAGRTVELGPKVAVIGGGNTAIDAARTARRLGSEVTILYRRTVAEMPADKIEIDEAQEENVKMEFLVAPLEIVRDGSGKVTGIQCQRMQLGEPDASGRPRPVPIPGSEFVVEATSIIPAVSQAADYTGLEAFRGPRGWINANESGETTEAGVWAGGDVINGLGIAAQAIGHGRRAALAVDAMLRGASFCEEKLPVIGKDRMEFGYYEKSPAVHRKHVAPDQRVKSFAESSSTITADDAGVEAKRCLSCGRCFFCERCWMFCQYNAVIKPSQPGEDYKFKLEFCNGCKKCSEQCPCGFIDMV